ncbi:hypothetical protein BY458DRAFT_495572 [Sporodiniella umbellata]|nr:hypothetical protein BY458DRAFT_495572 [Sporodiniella umbellata]
MSVNNFVLKPISFESSDHLSLSSSSQGSFNFKSRNKPYIPSDDEEEDESMDDDKPISIRRNQQLPSDDEDEDNQPLESLMNKPIPFVLAEGSRLQQRQRHYQYQQARLAQFNQRPSSMTGMDLLNQLEKEKAKRSKPKKPQPQVKIEGGLLGQLPATGSHSISFQQVEQEQMKLMKQRYLDPEQKRSSLHRSRSPSPHKK